jgi:rhomboid protease GluP
LVFTALGTTLMSALGSDSISLGASGMAFGVLGASAAFGWRRGVSDSLRSHFGLRVVPWLLALFAVGVGSAGVDNWGHCGGLVAGAVLGCFMAPRSWPGEGASRRLAAAAGALIGTLSLGVFAAPGLPALGPLREGPMEMKVKMPLGWRRAATAPDRVSYTNGLTGGFRSMATLLAAAPCHGRACACERVVRAAIEGELWRLADVGALRELHLTEQRARIDGLLEGSDGQMRVRAVCLQREAAPVAVVVMQPPPGSASLAQRMAATVRWPAIPDKPR